MLTKIFSHVLIDIRLSFSIMILVVGVTYYVEDKLPIAILIALLLAGSFTLLSLLSTIYDRNYLARMVTVLASLFYSIGAYMLLSNHFFTIASGVVIGALFLALGLGSKIYLVGYE